MVLGDNLKKILLAGLGTVAATAEKSKEILDELVKKGELTVEQGKILDRDLPKIDKEFPQNIRKAIKEKVSKVADKDVDPIQAFLDKLPREKFDELKERIRQVEEGLASEAEVGEEEAEAVAEEIVAEFEEEIEAEEAADAVSEEAAPEAVAEAPEE